MRKRLRPIQQIIDKRGRISGCVRLNVKVYCEPVEVVDLVDGVPDLERNTDNKFGAAATPQLSSTAPFRKLLILNGTSIQTTMRLSGPNTFTVMSAIK